MMTKFPNLILLTATEAWPAAIRRQNWPFRITWALDVDDLISEAALRPASVAVVEFAEPKIATMCRDFARTTNNPFDLCCLAVGNHGLCVWEPVIRAVGFVDVLWSTTQIGRLRHLASEHFNRKRPSFEIPLEERIQANFPWKPL